MIKENANENEYQPNFINKFKENLKENGTG